MTLLPDLAVDSTHLAGGLFPLAFFSSLGSPAVIYVDMRMRNRARFHEIEVRSKERLELERLRLELEAARSPVAASKHE